MQGLAVCLAGACSGQPFCVVMQSASSAMFAADQDVGQECPTYGSEHDQFTRQIITFRYSVSGQVTLTGWSAGWPRFSRI